MCAASADKTVGQCSCKPSWSEMGHNETTSASAGACVERYGDARVRGYCSVIPETCTSPPQRRRGDSWDFCLGPRAQTLSLNPPYESEMHLWSASSERQPAPSLRTLNPNAEP